MTTPSVPNPPDHPRPSWSSWLAVAAIPLAIAALFAPPPFNGLSLLAVVVAVLALILRGLESYNRTKENR